MRGGADARHARRALHLGRPQPERAGAGAGGERHRRKPILRLPAWLLLAAVRLLAKLHLPVPVEPGVLSFAVLYWFVDSSKATAELGYRQRSAEETLAPVVSWLRETGHFK